MHVINAKRVSFACFKKKTFNQFFLIHIFPLWVNRMCHQGSTEITQTSSTYWSYLRKK